MLESRGLPTVVVALIRLHAEKICPPRALAVAFQLGRPLGEPDDAAFQTRVLTAALGLLERTDGPVILADHAEEAPGRLDDPSWSPPPHAADPAAGPFAGAFAREVAELGPAWQAHRLRSGRTTIGLLPGGPATWPRFLAAFEAGDVPASPAPPMPPVLALKFFADDLRAFYGEAALGAGARPSSRQVDEWYWRGTAAGALVNACRRACLANADKSLHPIAENLLVPAPFRV